VCGVFNKEKGIEREIEGRGRVREGVKEEERGSVVQLHGQYRVSNRFGVRRLS
jgi:hypothetical protein